MREYLSRIIPLPEILRGKGWEIRDSGDDGVAYCSPERKQMVVPFSDSGAAEFGRSHEMGHVAWTPMGSRVSLRDDVDEQTFQTVEDCRINQALRTSGVNTNEKWWTPGALRQLESCDAKQLAQSLLAFRGTGHESEAREIAARVAPQAIEVADKIVREFFQDWERRGEIPPFEVTVKASEAFTDCFSSSDDESGESEGQNSDEGNESDGSETSNNSGENESMQNPPGQDNQDEESDEESEGNDSEGDYDADADTAEGSDEGDGNEGTESGEGKSEPQSSEREVTTSAFGDPTKSSEIPEVTAHELRDIESVIGENAARSYKYDDPNTGIPVPAELQRPELTKPFAPKGHSAIASDTGAIPRNFSRRTVDNRVFGVKRPRKSRAAVLVDVSGSMSISEHDLEMILTKYPAAVVAIYSGESRSGIIRIIAENKRRMVQGFQYETFDANGKMLRPMGGENLCDVAALEWLAKRSEEKKFWICDGIVTGIARGGTFVEFLSPKHIRELVRIVKLNRITRFHSISEFLHKEGKR